jgi:hypothetical protein
MELYGRVLDFYGRVAELYGRVLNFYGRTAELYGRVLKFYGRVAELYGRISVTARPPAGYNVSGRPMRTSNRTVELEVTVDSNLREGS